MAGALIRVEIDDAELKAKLARLQSRLGNVSPVLRTIGESLLNSTKDRFKSQTSPDGAKWKAHAPATVRARLKGQGNAPLTILRLRGRLVGSINYQVAGNQLKVGTNIVYGAIHQFGGKAGRGRKVTIPARPYLGISPADREDILATLDEWLAAE